MSDKKDNVVSFADKMKKSLGESEDTAQAKHIAELNAKTYGCGDVTSVLVNTAYAIGSIIGDFSQPKKIMESAPPEMPVEIAEASAKGSAAVMVLLSRRLTETMHTIADKFPGNHDVLDLLETMRVGLLEGIEDHGPDAKKPEDGAATGTVH
jgi:hypothetical protein